MRNYFIRKDAITFEEATRRTFEKHGDKIILLEFNGAHHKSLFQCKEHSHVWEADTWSVWSGNGCPFCYEMNRNDSLRIGIDAAKEFISLNNCELLSTEYKNNKTPLKIKFQCGHTGNICLDSFKRGARCKICGMERFKTSRKYSMERINKIMEENKLEFISFPNGYINRTSIIEYSCEFGHKNSCAFSSFLNLRKCYECSRIDLIKRVSGENASNWQGGKNSLKSFLGKQIMQWKRDSMKECNYECVLCGNGHRFDHVHHLYNFLSIMNDALSELNLDKRKNVCEYTSEELLSIANKVIEIHYRYPLGITLCWDHHKLFHKYYGNKNNTPAQFTEFKQRIQSGEIQLPG